MAQGQFEPGPASSGPARAGRIDGEARPWPENGDHRRTARRAKLQADAGLSELKLRERSGELIRKADAELLLFEKGREIRDSWLSWLARIAPAMASDLDLEPQKAFAWLDKAVRAHLLELSKVKPEIDIGVIAETEDVE